MNVISGDDSMMTSVDDGEQFIIKVEAAASGVNNLSSMLNADDIDLYNKTQMTSCWFCFIDFCYILKNKIRCMCSH